MDCQIQSTLRKVSGICLCLTFIILTTAGPAQSKRLLPFQGRLTDSAGNPVADGPYKIQFKIFDAPSGGSTMWDGEIHTATVNGGLVNVILGAKAPFGDSFTFSQILYLDITVDVNGDKVINESDPPMLPRQRIVPVIFAQDSGRLEGNRWQEFFLHPEGRDPARDPSKSRSKDAAKLKDLEWTDFFTSEDPANAKSKDADKLDGIDSAAIFVDPAEKENPVVKVADYARNAGNIPVGSIISNLSSVPPDGWLLCDGNSIGDVGSTATLTGAEYENLFNILKSVYPNQGTELFESGETVQLPDMRMRFPLGKPESGSLGILGGEEKHTLTIDEMPRHNHNDGNYSRLLIIDGNGTATSFDTCPYSEPNIGNGGNRGIKEAGGGQPHNNMPPYLTVNYMIKY